MDAAPGRMGTACANGHKLRLSRASSCWSLRSKKRPGRGKRKKCLGLPHPWAQLDSSSTDEALGGGERRKPELVRFHLFIPSLIQQLSLMCKMVLKKQPSNLVAHPNPWEEERGENISGR